MIALPKDLQDAVRSAGDQPVRVTDLETNSEYVVVPVKVYEQLTAGTARKVVSKEEQINCWWRQASVRVGITPDWTFTMTWSRSGEKRAARRRRFVIYKYCTHQQFQAYSERRIRLGCTVSL